MEKKRLAKKEKQDSAKLVKRRKKSITYFSKAH